MARDNQFSPDVHVHTDTLRPRCVDQHLVVCAVKRCCTNLVHTIGHRKNLPTSEVTQWHEQSTELPFRSPPRWYKTPHKSPELAMNNHQYVRKLLRCSKPSRWWQPPRITSESYSKTWTPNASRCNHSTNALGFSPNLTKMMNQW